jgi:DNA-binding LytR/AlgR family response regulator
LILPREGRKTVFKFIRGDKNMLTIAICDDENKILDELKTSVEEILRIHLKQGKILLFDSASDFYEDYNKTPIDILLLDIDMPDKSGMELAKEISLAEQDIVFAFVTNQEALVYQSFECHPFAFLRKDYLKEELESTLLRMIDTVFSKAQTYSFSYRGGINKVLIEDIIYFESDLNYVKLVTTKEIYRYRETLSNLCELFHGKKFLRIHKGFLLNMNYIYSIRQEEVELTNHTVLPIGRTNREAVKNQLFRYLRGTSL